MEQDKPADKNTLLSKGELAAIKHLNEDEECSSPSLDQVNEKTTSDCRSQNQEQFKTLELTRKVGGLIDHPYTTLDQDQENLNKKRKDGSRKMYSCVFCGKSFPRQYMLNRHLPVHTDERQYGCKLCGKKFRQASSLSRHKVVHTNEKHFKCALCDKSFNRVSTLIAHEKIHTGQKVHICPTCGKGFHQKGNLKNHVFTHTGEKPFVCNMESCRKSFNQLSNLTAHVAARHKESVCGICQMAFKTAKELKVHEADKHLIMNIPPSSHGSTNYSKEKGTQMDHVPVPVHPSVGRGVNDPRSQTVTFPNGDKTIIHRGTVTPNANNSSCNLDDMDPGVRAAASILMQMESGVGSKKPIVDQKTITNESVGGEKPVSIAANNGVQIEQVQGKEIVKAGSLPTPALRYEVEGVDGSTMVLWLHYIGESTDGHNMAVLSKEDGSLGTLVKLSPTNDSVQSSQQVVENSELQLPSPLDGNDPQSQTCWVMNNCLPNVVHEQSSSENSQQELVDIINVIIPPTSTDDQVGPVHVVFDLIQTF